MAVSECALVANSLTITRVMEMFEKLADYNFVTKAPVNAKGGEVYVFKPGSPEEQDMTQLILLCMLLVQNL